MEKETYIVLRVEGAPRTIEDPFYELVWREEAAAKGIEPIVYRIETEALDRRDYQELHRDPGVAALRAEHQLWNSGMVNLRALPSQLLGRATKNRRAGGLDVVDMGSGLVSAPSA